MLEIVAVRKAPLLILAVLLFLAKCMQFAIDSTALFCYRFGLIRFERIGTRVFIPEPSYVYGYLIRIFAIPFHSLRAIVAMQLVMGSLTAWVLGFVLAEVSKGAALGSRSWQQWCSPSDPAQIIDEHMVMAETTAMLAMALFLLLCLPVPRGAEACRLHWSRLRLRVFCS